MRTNVGELMFANNSWRTSDGTPRKYTIPVVAYAENISLFKIMVGLIWGLGTETPGRWRIFEIFGKFLRKLYFFAHFSLKF